MKLADWKRKYKKERGQAWPHKQQLFDEQRGMAAISTEGNTLRVLELFGDRDFWVKYLQLAAMKKGMEFSPYRLTFEEIEARFIRRNGDSEYVPIEGGETVFNERGFLHFKVIPGTHGGKCFYVDGLYGPGQGVYWEGVIDQLAKANGCKMIMIVTSRRAEAVQQLFGYKPRSTIMTKEVT